MTLLEIPKGGIIKMTLNIFCVLDMHIKIYIYLQLASIRYTDTPITAPMAINPSITATI